MRRPSRLVPVVALAFVLGICWRAPTPAGENLSEAIDRYLSALSGQGYGFTVLVSMDDRVVLRHGYGWTDTSRRCRTTEHTLFNLASITKSFTAIAILQLREQGKLKLESTLPAFFPDVPKDKLSITVHQLFLHTSGLGQNYAADGVRDRDLAVRTILNDALGFAPGTNFSYSNENYELLAAIIEVAAGETYEGYIRRHILAEGRMTNTRFWSEVNSFGGCAVAPPSRKLDPDVLGRNWGYVGSGGMYSNILDLHCWFLALTGGRLIDRSSLDLMWRPQRTLSSTSAAYGWYVSTQRDITEIWTRGSEDWGHNGVLRWFPERRVLVIVQSNSGELGDKAATANRFISDEIVRMVFDNR